MATTAQEIALMKQRMDSFENKLDSLDDKIDLLTAKLLDPDTGFVARVNKNTEGREERESLMPMYNKIIEDFMALQRWKDTVTKALWVLYVAAAGALINLIW